MSGTEMNKYQLIAGVIGDLGDKDRGLQVQGYQNMKIVTDVIECLCALQEGLRRDEEETQRLISEKDAEIAMLRAELNEITRPHHGGEIRAEEAAPNED